MNAQIKMREIKLTDRSGPVAIAFDRESVRSFDADGHMTVAEANICKECVSPYRGREIPGWDALGLDPEKVYNLYRPGDELEKAAATSNGKPILRRHLRTSADDHQFWDTIGAVGTAAKWQKPFIKNSLSIWVQPDIDAIKSGAKRELSPGYRYTPVMEPGAFDGQPYDGRMEGISFNHLAVVEEGRQGDDVVIGDSAAEAAWARIENAIMALGASQ